jgi:formamidopyrimidine-DNA glycosylase
LGKRIVFEVEGDVFLVFHLMIAGRFRWRAPGAKVPGRVGLLAIDFDHGTLLLTEAGTRKQASLHVVAGRAALAQHDPGGLEVADASLAAFRQALQRENHTLKRALTDPHLFSGIGNAYSDEILHAARLSPFKQTGQLTDEELRRLHFAARETISKWIGRLQDEAGGDFPEKVTAFREGMAVHGRYGKPCPDCGSPVQRVVYAANEANYCATCQTGGRLLADRSLSRLLRNDWPRTLEELERRRGDSSQTPGRRPKT